MAKISGLFLSKINRITLHAIFSLSLLGNTTLVYSNPSPKQPSQPQCTGQKLRKVAKIEASQCLETTSYPDFKFNHMFSMLVIAIKVINKV